MTKKADIATLRADIQSLKGLLLAIQRQVAAIQSQGPNALAEQLASLSALAVRLDLAATDCGCRWREPLKPKRNRAP